MVLGVCQFLGDDVRFCCAKTGGLGLAAALGHGFGEIREEHREPQPEDDLDRKAVVPGRPIMTSRTKSTVTRSATTSTTNITGFFASVTGLSFLKDSPMAGIRIFGSVIVAVGVRLLLAVAAGASMDFHLEAQKV